MNCCVPVKLLTKPAALGTLDIVIQSILEREHDFPKVTKLEVGKGSLCRMMLVLFNE